MKSITAFLFSLMMIPLLAVHHEGEGHSMKDKNDFAYLSTYVIPENTNPKNLKRLSLKMLKRLRQMAITYAVYCVINLVQKEAFTPIATLMILNSLQKLMITKIHRVM